MTGYAIVQCQIPRFWVSWDGFDLWPKFSVFTSFAFVVYFSHSQVWHKTILELSELIDFNAFILCHLKWYRRPPMTLYHISHTFCSKMSTRLYLVFTYFTFTVVQWSFDRFELLFLLPKLDSISMDSSSPKARFNSSASSASSTSSHIPQAQPLPSVNIKQRKISGHLDIHAF